jgi:hypothetical protein
MQIVLMLVKWIVSLGWMGLVVAAAILVGLYFAARLFVEGMFRSVANEALRQVSGPLADAELQVHSITPAERPTMVSVFDVEDEEFEDGEFGGDTDYLEGWQTEGEFYWIDATITPRDPASKWDASVLTLVPAVWKGKPGEICEEIGPLHSIELYDGRNFRLLHNGEETLRGEQRLRLLMACPEARTDVKFTYFGVTFGRLSLPTPVGVG